MRNLSTYLKIGAIIAGILVMLWSFFIGLLGVGPDGPVPIHWRIAGIVMFVNGLLYCIPNHILIRNKRVAIAYLAVTAIPITMVVGLTIWELITNGINCFLSEGGVIQVSVYILLFCLAPASLIIRQRNEASKHCDYRRPEAVSTSSVTFESKIRH